LESTPLEPERSDRRTVTQLLQDWRGGDRDALERLAPLVYKELHRLAASHMRREHPGHTLHATELIHEAYLRMVDQTLPEFNSRSHFYGVAAHYMRQILVDHARARQAKKRGGGAHAMTLDEASAYVEGRPEDLLELDRALSKLAALDERKARIVELRYFGGLTPPETADVLGISISSVSRDLRSAEAWLRRELAGGQ
jgi:RNA polymerase sigma-70 factor (ECF subfamily)